MVYGERSGAPASLNATGSTFTTLRRWNFLLLFVSASPPFSFFLKPICRRFSWNLWALLGLLNLSRSQPSWPQSSACGGGHYASALGLEMTRVTDDIRKSHFPRRSLPNSCTATRWWSWHRVFFFFCFIFFFCCCHFHLCRITAFGIFFFFFVCSVPVKNYNYRS